MDHEAMEVSNRGLASDGGQASCVAISERRWRGTSLEASADHFGDVAAALFRRGREAGNGLSAPRKAGGYVANREDPVVSLDREILSDNDPARPVPFGIQPRARGGSLHAGRPQHGPRGNDFARQDYAFGADLLDLRIEANRHAQSPKSGRRVDRQSWRKGR